MVVGGDVSHDGSLVRLGGVVDVWGSGERGSERSGERGE